MRRYHAAILMIATVFCLAVAWCARAGGEALLDTPRVWTSVRGSKLKSVLLDVTDSTAVLRNKGGLPVAIPISQLSADDQRIIGFVHEFLRGQIKPTKPVNAVYVVETEDGAGTGFLARQDVTVYFYSNFHIFAGGKAFNIVDASGNSLKLPNVIEVAVERDLIRFRAPNTNALTITDQFQIGDKIHAMGNSGGAGVFRPLDGEIIGLGPERIEISAQIIPGNSGGPILDTRGQVVGVATLLLQHENLPAWIKEGTPFTETRRLGLRLNNVEWCSMPTSVFISESGFMITAADDLMEAAVAAVQFVEAPFSQPVNYEFSLSALNGWRKVHNDKVAEFRKRLGSRADRGSVKSKNNRMRNAYELWGKIYRDRLHQESEVIEARARKLPESHLRARLLALARFSKWLGDAVDDKVQETSTRAFYTLG